MCEVRVTKIYWGRKSLSKLSTWPFRIALLFFPRFNNLLVFEQDPVMIDKEVNNIKNILACSICYGPLTAAAGSALSVYVWNLLLCLLCLTYFFYCVLVINVFIYKLWCRESTNGYQLECRTCKKSFTGSESHLDLTIASGINNSESMPAATEIFRYFNFIICYFMTCD